ncbi:C-C chemokine receptor type 10 [Pleurodeles waltl]|uniref:C-C chemokine receptor type 10 n=1 Tax=Pleurodeles waltl TaxID=8319 RepID=UPI003709C249
MESETEPSTASFVTIWEEGSSLTIYDGDIYSIDYSSMPERCEKNDVRDFSRVYQPCIYSVVFVLGIVGNSLVLATYIYYRKIQSMTDVFLLNLALSDLLLLMTFPFITISSIHGWVFGTGMCKLLQGLYTINFYSGFLFLTCVSVDRYIMIVRATSARKLRLKTAYYSKVISVTVWFFSVLLTLPQFVYSRSELRDSVHLCRMIFPEDVTKVVKGLTNVTQVTLGFLIPFVLMVFCYSVIIKTLLVARNFEKHKALKVIISLVVVFFIFQLPYNLVTFLETTDFLWSRQMTCTESKQRDIAIIVTSSLAFTRCCLNPVLYAFVGVKFRKEVLQMMKNVSCKGRFGSLKQQESQRSSKRYSSSTNMDTSSFTL